MKKTLIIMAAMVLAIGMMMGCASKSSNPPDDPAAATATPVPADTSTPVPVGTVAFNFNSSIGTWANETAGDQQGITAVTYDATNGVGATGCLKATCAFTDNLGAGNNAKGAIKYDPATALDLTGKTLTFKVYIPSGLATAEASNPYGIQVFIKTTGSWVWHDAGWVNLDVAGWNTFTYTPSGVSESDTREIGVQIGKGGSTTTHWSGDIYVDDVNW
jgi:hypothetical protein